MAFPRNQLSADFSRVLAGRWHRALPLKKTGLRHVLLAAHGRGYITRTRTRRGEYDGSFWGTADMAELAAGFAPVENDPERQKSMSALMSAIGG